MGLGFNAELKSSDCEGRDSKLKEISVVQDGQTGGLTVLLFRVWRCNCNLTASTKKKQSAGHVEKQKPYKHQHGLGSKSKLDQVDPNES